MSCGLGAIVLVFLLVKDNVEPAAPEAARLQSDLRSLAERQRALRDDIRTATDRRRTADRRLQTVSRELSDALEEAETRGETAAEKRRRIAALEEEIRNIDPAETADVIETPEAGEERYLIGLGVEGRKVGILVDRSASMTDETLLDVIRRKNAPDAEKQAGPKWQRTKAIVRWLLARLPAEAEVSVVTYGAAAGDLGGRGWKSGRDAAALEAVLRALDAIVPTGATNLHAGLKAIYAQQPTNVYVVTDGLPTQGASGYKSLNPFAACSALWGGAGTISGDCRRALFRHTVNEAKPPAGLAALNVILLPIEGDPEAAVEYWLWTAASGGLLITPAETWP